MRKAFALTAAAAAVVLAAGARPAAPGAVAFSPRVTNPWFPLRPGATYVYTGVRERQPVRDVVTVTHGTKRVAGALCAVVHDRLYVQGRLRERTTDWYAQDRRGNVWYFGEATAELEKGRVTTTEGSWQAGRGGARAGIYMPARPRLGATGRQEYYEGHAEDHFRVLDLRTSVAVPYVASGRALLTEEWTPLEPGVVDHKYYVRSVGTVLEESVGSGSPERLELVSLRRR
jgi:hypothetical protein